MLEGIVRPDDDGLRIRYYDGVYGRLNAPARTVTDIAPTSFPRRFSIGDKGDALCIRTCSRLIYRPNDGNPVYPDSPWPRKL